MSATLKSILTSLSLLLTVVSSAQCEDFSFSINSFPSTVCSGDYISYSLYINGSEELYEITTQMNGNIESISFGGPGPVNITFQIFGSGFQEVEVYVNGGIGGGGIGCNGSDSFTTNIDAGISLPVTISSNPSCLDFDHGNVFFTLDGDNIDYESLNVNWTPFPGAQIEYAYQNNVEVYNVPAGEYELIISGYAGCGSSLASVTVELMNPEPQFELIDTDNAVGCNANGSVTIFYNGEGNPSESFESFLINGEAISDFDYFDGYMVFSDLICDSYVFEAIPELWNNEACNETIEFEIEGPESNYYFFLMPSASCSGVGTGKILIMSEGINVLEWGTLSFEFLQGSYSSFEQNMGTYCAYGLAPGSYTVHITSSLLFLDQTVTFEIDELEEEVTLEFVEFNGSNCIDPLAYEISFQTTDGSAIDPDDWNIANEEFAPLGEWWSWYPQTVDFDGSVMTFSGFQTCGGSSYINFDLASDHYSLGICPSDFTIDWVEYETDEQILPINVLIEEPSCDGEFDGSITYVYPEEYDLSVYFMNLYITEPSNLTLNVDDAIVEGNEITFNNISNGMASFDLYAGSCNNNCFGFADVVEIGALDCEGDFNGDGVIDVADLLIFIGDFGCTGADCSGDINGDGTTNIADLLLFLNIFN